MKYKNTWACVGRGALLILGKGHCQSSAASSHLVEGHNNDIRTPKKNEEIRNTKIWNTEIWNTEIWNTEIWNAEIQNVKILEKGQCHATVHTAVFRCFSCFHKGEVCRNVLDCALRSTRGNRERRGADAQSHPQWGNEELWQTASSSSPSPSSVSSLLVMLFSSSPACVKGGYSGGRGWGRCPQWFVRQPPSWKNMRRRGFPGCGGLNVGVLGLQRQKTLNTVFKILQYK